MFPRRTSGLLTLARLQWDLLSPIWGSQDITVLRTKFESPQSWLNYKNSFGTVVDRFRWEGGCIAEHVCHSNILLPSFPIPYVPVGNSLLTCLLPVGPGRGLPRGLRVLRGMAVWRGQQRGLQFWMSCRDWNLRSTEKPLHDLVSKWFSMSITYRLNRENPPRGSQFK